MTKLAHPHARDQYTNVEKSPGEETAATALPAYAASAAWGWMLEIGLERIAERTKELAKMLISLFLQHRRRDRAAGESYRWRA